MPAPEAWLVRAGQEQCQERRAGGEPDLDPARQVLDHRQERPDEERRGRARPRARGRGGGAARERRLREGGRGQVEAHPDRHDREIQAVVLEAVAERDLHQGWADGEHHDERDRREPRDDRERRPDRAVERLLAASRAHAGEVGEEARRDALEDEDRRAGDHEDVEYEARRGGVFESSDQERAGVQEHLLADHDHQHSAREAAARGKGDGARERFVAARASGPRQHQHGDQREAHQRRCRDSKRDGLLAFGDAHREGKRAQRPGRRLRHQQSRQEVEAAHPAEVAPEEERGAEANDGGEQHPVERFRAGEKAVLKRVAEQKDRDGKADRDRQLNSRGGADRRRDVLSAGDAVGESAREELLDRPVRDGDGHEHGRPEDDDLAVLGRIEVVRGQREEEVREQTRDAHPRGQEARRAPEAPRLRAGAHFAHQRHGIQVSAQGVWHLRCLTPRS